MRQQILAGIGVLAMVLTLGACGESEEPAEGTMAEADGGAGGDVISQRQDLLEGMGDAFRTIRGQLEGDADMAVIAASAETLNANAAQIIDLFPEGTGMDSGADTEALATIWEDPEGFATAHARLMDASAAMLDAVATGDPAQVEAAVGPLGGACGNCHDSFRLDDED